MAADGIEIATGMPSVFCCVLKLRQLSRKQSPPRWTQTFIGEGADMLINTNVHNSADKIYGEEQGRGGWATKIERQSDG